MSRKTKLIITAASLVFLIIVALVLTPKPNNPEEQTPETSEPQY